MSLRHCINIVEETQREPAWRAIMVYGSFDDKETDKNFFLVRIPVGRVPWSRKIAPAIDRLVRSFFSPQDIRKDQMLRRMGRESLIYWNVEGDDTKGNGGKSIWDIKQAVSRYEWNGTELVKVQTP